jgi:hypothetical protein
MLVINFFSFQCTANNYPDFPSQRLFEVLHCWDHSAVVMTSLYAMQATDSSEDDNSLVSFIDSEKGEEQIA